MHPHPPPHTHTHSATHTQVACHLPCNAARWQPPRANCQHAPPLARANPCQTGCPVSSALYPYTSGIPPPTLSAAAAAAQQANRKAGNYITHTTRCRRIVTQSLPQTFTASQTGRGGVGWVECAWVS